MLKNKKHIVIISIWYPPIIGVAVNRIHAFAKYLDKEKYNISVVTLWKKGYKEFEKEGEISIYRLKNNSLLKLPSFDKKLPKPIHYLKVIWKLFVLKIKHDEFEKWTASCTKKLQEINESNAIDLVLSSYSPIAPHLAALQFIKTNPQIKWIADMRDEMSRNPFLSDNIKRKYKILEKEINEYTTAITTVSLPILNDFKKDFTNVKHFEEIRNGFDHKFDLNGNTFNKIFTISYVGSFYGEIKPTNFLEALNNLHKQNKLPLKFQLKFIGSQHNFQLPKSLTSYLQFSNKVTQFESLKIMMESDINLLLLPNSGRKGVYSGKLFDYLSINKPILALVDKNDVAAQLIKELNAGYIADFNNIKEIEEMITLAIENWKNKKSIAMDIDGIKKLHRKYGVENLEQLIDKIV